MSSIGKWAGVFLFIPLAGCYYPVYQPYPVYPPAYSYNYAAPQPSYTATVPSGQCASYSESAVIGGKNERLTGTACRASDGSWKDSLNGSPVDMGPITTDMPIVPSANDSELTPSEHIMAAPTVSVQTTNLPADKTPSPSDHE